MEAGGVLMEQQLTEKQQPTHNIFETCQRGDLEELKILVEKHGIDPRIHDAENCSTLHWAAINNRCSVINYLIDAGIHVDVIGGDLKGTPLQWAIRQGFMDTVVLLIKHGADPSICDVQSFNSLMIAAQYGHVTICAYLLARGSPMDVLDKDGRTSLMWAAYRVYSADLPRLFISFDAAVNLEDITHNTALHWACAAGNVYATRELLNCGARFDSKNSENMTPLDIAKDRGHKRVVSLLESEVKKRWGGDGSVTGNSSGIFRIRMMRYLFSSELQFRQRMSHVVCHLAFVALLLFTTQFSWPMQIAGLIGTTYALVRIQSANVVSTKNNSFMLAMFVSTCMWIIGTDIFVLSPAVYSPMLQVIFFALCLGFAYNFYKAVITDPGFINVSISQRKAELIALAEKGDLQSSRFCSSCIIRKPLRSKHCSVCGRCIARFDHHCVFLMNCVGQGNHRYFINYLLCLSAAGILYIKFSYQYFHSQLPIAESFFHHVYNAIQLDPWSFWIMILNSVHVLWITALFIAQLYQVSLGLTTNERINHSRYSYLGKDDKGNGQTRVINRGLIRNCLDFCGCHLFGLYHPQRTDWSTIYESTRLDNDSSCGHDCC